VGTGLKKPPSSGLPSCGMPLTTPLFSRKFKMSTSGTRSACFGTDTVPVR
jgi:hypothetical protein